jgi:hypothetical protein
MVKVCAQTALPAQKAAGRGKVSVAHTGCWDTHDAKLPMNATSYSVPCFASLDEQIQLTQRQRSVRASNSSL